MTLEELAGKLNTKYRGSSDLRITHVSGLDSLSEGGLAYVTDPSGPGSVPVPEGMGRTVEARLEKADTSAMAFIVPREFDIQAENLIFAEDPLDMHVQATRLLHEKAEMETGVHRSAVLAEDVELGKEVWIGARVVVGKRVRIGDRTRIHPGAVIQEKSSIGSGCEIFPNAVIQDRSEIGNRVIIQSNAVIGADGHGYYQRDGINFKIPQVGRVVIEDDVEIGACTTIDRARFTETVIGRGSKIDNQVQIAHNVHVGEQALISAQTAIGGSVKAGHHLILGGQSGVRDNVRVGSGVTVAARAVITANTQDGEVLGGMPSRPLAEWRRIQSLVNRLGELFERVRRLEGGREGPEKES